jgi:hypothetical protein
MMTSVDYGLQIVTAAGGIRRINDTFSILKDERTQQYMQVSAIRTNQEDAGVGQGCRDRPKVGCEAFNLQEAGVFAIFFEAVPPISPGS